MLRVVMLEDVADAGDLPWSSFSSLLSPEPSNFEFDFDVTLIASFDFALESFLDFLTFALLLCLGARLCRASMLPSSFDLFVRVEERVTCFGSSFSGSKLNIV